MNDVLVRQYDCREGPNIGRFDPPNKLDDCKKKPHWPTNIKTGIGLLMRATATMITAQEYSFSNLKNKKVLIKK